MITSSTMDWKTSLTKARTGVYGVNGGFNRPSLQVQLFGNGFGLAF